MPKPSASILNVHSMMKTNVTVTSMMIESGIARVYPSTPFQPMSSARSVYTVGAGDGSNDPSGCTFFAHGNGLKSACFQSFESYVSHSSFG